MPFISSASGSFGYGRSQTETSSGPPIGTVRILIVGDSSVSGTVTPLQNAKTALGYSLVTLTISTVTVTGSYTGADILISNYDCVMVYTNGGITYTAALGTALANYVAAGGALITCVFSYSIRIPNYPWTSTPLNYNQGGTTGQANGTNGNRTDVVTHPITTDISTSTTGGAATFYNTFLGVTDANSSIISVFSSNNTLPMIAVRTSSGGIRSVSFNMFGLYVSNYTRFAQLMVRAILWSTNKIS